MAAVTDNRVTRPRVLLVAPQPFFRVTGTPINVLMMCRALTENGFAVDLLALPGGEDVALPELTIHRTARLPFSPDVPVGFSPAKALYNGLVLVRMLTLLLSGRYVAVHAIEEAAFYAVPLARLLMIPAITDLDSDLCRQLRDHGSGLTRILALAAGALRRFALKRSTCAISVAEQLTAMARSEAAGTPVYEINDIPIDSAVRSPDPVRMAELRRELKLEGKRLIVYTGNLDRRQGVEDLTVALSRVLDVHPDAALLIVGGTAERVEALRQLARRNGLGDVVHLTGTRPPEEMAEYMALATVLVSPRLEPYATPLKIFSYMASGRPIVATDLPTHTQVLNRDSAVLVPTGADGLAHGINRLLADAALAAALGARARALVNERYTYAIFKGRLRAAYRSIYLPPFWPPQAADIQETPAHG